MGEVPLPEDLSELENSLSAKLQQLDDRIEASSRHRKVEIEQRLGVVRTFADQFAQRARIAEQLGLPQEVDEIGSLVQRLKQEEASLESLLEGIPNVLLESSQEQGAATTESAEEAAESPHSADEAETEDAETVDDAEPDQGSAPQSEGSTTKATTSSPPTEDTVPDARPTKLETPLPPLADPLLTADDVKSEVAKLVSRADSLLQAAHGLEANELKRRVELLAYEGRIAQSKHPDLADHATGSGQELKAMFGRLSKICQEVLNRTGMYVKGLRHADTGDWQRLWREALTDLNGLLESKRKQTEDDRRRVDAERVRASRERADEQHAQEMLEELEDLFADETRPPDWQASMLQLTEEVVTHAKEIPERLIELVGEFAGQLQGRAFRRLRRELSRRGLHESQGSGRHAAVVPGDNGQTTVEAAEASPSAKASDSPLSRWRGQGRGKSAVIVGGTAREHTVRRVKNFFEFGDVEWVENERSERAPADSLVKRIRNGNVHIVFFLARFTSHTLQEKLKAACRDSGCPFALVLHGYGLPQLCRALDETGQFAQQALSVPEA